MASKTCAKCNAHKSVNDFYTRQDGSLVYPCKKCHNAMSKRWRDKNKEYRKNYDLVRNCGATLSQKMQLIAEQNNKCAICKNPLEGGQKTCLDHCHASGKIRGVLCAHCNTGLGKFKDSPDYLESAIAYLNQHREAQLGQ